MDMDDLGTFLYILFSLIAIVAGSLRQSKARKKIPKGKDVVAPQDPMDDERSIFDTIRGEWEQRDDEVYVDDHGEEVILVPEQPGYQEETKYTQESVEEEVILDTIPEEEGVSTTVEEEEDLLNPEINYFEKMAKEEEKAAQQEAVRFNLRDAVIYDAIWRRPYE